MGLFGTIAKGIGVIFRTHTPESVWGSQAEPTKPLANIPTYRGSSPIKAGIEALTPSPVFPAYKPERGSSPLKTEIEKRFPTDLPWTRPGPYQEAPLGTPFSEEPLTEPEAPPPPETEIEKYLAGGHWLEVTSSNVHSIMFEPEYNQLLIRFLDDSYYMYFDVTPGEAEDLALADSKGKWVWRHLRLLGSIFGHQKDYVFMDWMSSVTRLWNKNAETRAAHGAVPRTGESWSEMLLIYEGVVPPRLIRKSQFNQGRP